MVSMLLNLTWIFLVYFTYIQVPSEEGKPN